MCKGDRKIFEKKYSSWVQKVVFSNSQLSQKFLTSLQNLFKYVAHLNETGMKGLVRKYILTTVHMTSAKSKHLQ